MLSNKVVQPGSHLKGSHRRPSSDDESAGALNARQRKVGHKASKTKEQDCHQTIVAGLRVLKWRGKHAQLAENRSQNDSSGKLSGCCQIMPSLTTGELTPVPMLSPTTPCMPMDMLSKERVAYPKALCQDGFSLDRLNAVPSVWWAVTAAAPVRSI